jgi:hypothetical protein
VKSFRNIVTMGAVVIGSFAGVANAAQLIVFEQPVYNWGEEVSAVFAANRELGRAWIDVGVTSAVLGEEPPTVQVIPKAVEGLYYDSARKQVLYRAGAETIVCAEDATFLWSTYLKSTGQCMLSPRIEQRKIDDGFAIRDQRVAKVVFEALTSPASQHAAATQAITPKPTVAK